MKKKELLERKLHLLQEQVRRVEAELRTDHGVSARTAPVSSPFSLQGRVINHVITLLRQKRGAVSSREILDHLRKEKVDLGHYPPMMLAAILGQEVHKKSARLNRVARGLYSVKPSTVPVDRS